MSAVAGPDEPPGLVLHVGAATDTGRVRDHNEDSALAEGGIFVVADGMGGHAAGEVASGIVVETMRELVSREDLTADGVNRQLGRRSLDLRREPERERDPPPGPAPAPATPWGGWLGLIVLVLILGAGVQALAPLAALGLPVGAPAC